MLTVETGMRGGVCALLLLGVSGCVTDGMLAAGDRTVNAIGGGRPEAFTDSYAGPRVRVAVSRFDVVAPQAQDDVGAGLADMLRVALAETSRFRALQPLNEEDLAALTGPAGAPAGSQAVAIAGQRFARPDLLVIGTVTEFEPNVSATSTSIGPDSFLNQFIGATTMGFGTSHIAVNLRLVEPETTEIVAATTVEAKASAIDAFDMAGGELGMGLSGYAHTPMEKALRQVIEEATAFLIEKTPPEYFRAPLQS